MGERWFIIADDLTGAADSAIAFARRRMSATVVWGAQLPQTHADTSVLSYDAATREVDHMIAGRRHAEVLHRFMAPGMRLFKKIDSTLRGHPAEEIAAMLDVLGAHTRGARAVLAPAFPSAGRTTRGGHVFVHGARLEFTDFWPEGQPPELANLVTLLETAGLHARHIPLATVRADPRLLREALAAGHLRIEQGDVAVCDAETDEDLRRIALASIDEVATLFIGSAGLAHALAESAARAIERRPASRPRQPVTRGALVVVGSLAQASRVALSRVLGEPRVTGMGVDAKLLSGSLQSEPPAAFTREIIDALERGEDVVAYITSAHADIVDPDPTLVVKLARLLAPAVRHASALAATGGATAAALLEYSGVDGISLLDEIEPGIALGLTLGELSIPAVTKAGGFGNEDCLKRIIARLRFIRQTGTVA